MVIFQIYALFRFAFEMKSQLIVDVGDWVCAKKRA